MPRAIHIRPQSKRSLVWNAAAICPAIKDMYELVFMCVTFAGFRENAKKALKCGTETTREHTYSHANNVMEIAIFGEEIKTGFFVVNPRLWVDCSLTRKYIILLFSFVRGWGRKEHVYQLGLRSSILSLGHFLIGILKKRKHLLSRSRTERVNCTSDGKQCQYVKQENPLHLLFFKTTPDYICFVMVVTA